VVTSNKWPIALHGVQLGQLAATRGVALRAESTVVSVTPLLGPLTEGLAGAVPIGLRGIVNATANFILSAMVSGVLRRGARGGADGRAGRARGRGRCRGLGRPGEGDDPGRAGVR
jgi:hypothetical protein